MATKPLAYNPPPNWPKPPGGWTPQPGWTPDPAWGPAPAGWQLWVKPKGSRAGKAMIVVGILLLVVVGIAVAASGSGSKNPNPASLGSTDSQPTAIATTSPVVTPAPAVVAPTKAAPKMTKGEEEALGSAQDYLSLSGFSEKGLIDQLVQGDGYSKADATFAAKHVHANWDAEAAQSAKSYLQISHFSRSGLIDQLVQGDGYTKAQATYGAKKAGL